MNTAVKPADTDRSAAAMHAEVESQRATLRGIHRELTLLESESAQLGSLLKVAEHAVRTNSADDGDVQNAIAETLYLASQRLEATSDRLAGMKVMANAGYAEGGAA